MIPGSNILNAALRVISSNPFTYYAFSARQAQANGQYLALYSAPVPLRGSVQPVPRNLYQQMGLQLDKTYYNFFVSKDAVDVGRDVSGDQIYFQGNMYQCQSLTPWHTIDGWVQILTVQVQNIPLINSLTAPANGEYDTDDNLDFVVNYNQAITVTGTPIIGLTAVTGIISGNAAYISGSGTLSLTFRYTVVLADTANGIVAASPISGTIKNAAGLPANNSFAAPNLGGVVLN